MTSCSRVWAGGVFSQDNEEKIKTAQREIPARLWGKRFIVPAFFRRKTFEEKKSPRYLEKISCFNVAFRILSSWGFTPIPGAWGTAIIPSSDISKGGSIKSCL